MIYEYMKGFAVVSEENCCGGVVGSNHPTIQSISFYEGTAELVSIPFWQMWDKCRRDVWSYIDVRANDTVGNTEEGEIVEEVAEGADVAE